MSTVSRRHLLRRAPIVLSLPLAATLAFRSTGRGLARQDTGDRVWPTDGWETVAPDELGIDPEVFAAAAERIAGEAPSLSALVTTVGGRIVDEWYADGVDDGDSTDIWSSTKSVTSMITGIAIGDGLFALDSRLGDLIPDRIPADADPGTPDITVRDLLTMTAGWDWEGTVDYANLDTADDYAARTLALPIVGTPGQSFTYNSGCAHVLSLVIAEASGQSLRDYADERLFAPIGVEVDDWLETAQGETAGGWGLTITPRQMASIGYLMLNDGAWDGAQVVPADWVTESTAGQSNPIPENDFGGGTGYGYLWWLDEVAGAPAYFSLGYGESSIMVVPDLDLVMVAATADVPALAAAGEQARPRPIMRDLIAPAVAAAR